MKLLEKLCAEKTARYKGGIYHKLQIDFAYNSNHIEGSRLTHDQTRYIYETRTIGADADTVIRVNDIIETVNHFKCFDHILDTVSEPLTEEYVKNLHRILKSGVLDADAVIGAYKQEENMVGETETALPEEVADRMKKLLAAYDKLALTFYEIAAFHTEYERIHPFYDGNGRTGRLLMFKQCLANNIVPFFIDEFHKMYYYMGLKEWQTENKDERLISVFLSSQDYMKRVMDYFKLDYDHTELKYKDVLAQARKNC
ncbi:MAG: Fic family protein [Oscillospiraceae bacterium]|nr:Fic family protein [Oscillospiraceae bacterium]